jgi:hypothetical protein
MAANNQLNLMREAGVDIEDLDKEDANMLKFNAGLMEAE